MRTLAITQNITLDGSIEMLGDWFDPQGHGQDVSDIYERMAREDAENDAIVLGRDTFESFRSYWPQQSDDPTGAADQLERLQKYVVSSTMTDPEWDRSTIIDSDPVAAVAALKEQPGQDIVVTGSIRLCHDLIEAGIVDQYRLFVYPTVQGRGRRLFPDGCEIPELTLLESEIFQSGIAYLRYGTA